MRPAANFLVADSDYVEVLTEIAIRTPIPDVVKERRTNRGLFFVGCRFDDQVLRTYARQIMKCSKGPHFAVIDAATLTKTNAVSLQQAQSRSVTSRQVKPRLGLSDQVFQQMTAKIVERRPSRLSISTITIGPGS